MSGHSADTLYRRGALAGALSLGVCCLAVWSLPSLSASAVPPTSPSDSVAAEGVVFVDEAMLAKSTRKSGFAPYTTHSDTLDGKLVPRSLITEVGGAKPSDTLSVLTLKIDGKYERFQATVGRNDEEARTGPAYVFFEVWGDGTCFFRSTPIRSAATMVTTAPGANTRKTPQAIDIIVRGTRTLQLVTRFATIEQQAPGITRARGCVWGDPRLLPPAAISARSAPPAVSLPVPPTVVNPVPVKNRSEMPDPRREGVRMGVLLLASALGSTSDTALSPATLHYPLKVALLPLRPWVTTTGRQRSKQATVQSADPTVQQLLETSLPTAKRGKEFVFTLLNPDAASEMAYALPLSLTTSSELTGAALTSLAPLCRAKEVDAVLIATLLPGSGMAGRSGNRLELRLFDAATGAPLSQSLQILPAVRKN